MTELYGLMNLLDPEKYEDEEDFLENFGGGKDGISLEQVQALQVTSLDARIACSDSCRIAYSHLD